MKGLRKQAPRAVNPNPRVYPSPSIGTTTTTVNEYIKIDIVTEPMVETTPIKEEDKQEEKKSIKTQTINKPSKWNKQSNE